MGWDKIPDMKPADVGFDNLDLQGEFVVNQTLRSPQFVTGTAGWKLDADGTAELNSVTVGAVYAVLPVKTTTGDPSSPTEGQIYVNTFDNKIRVYADAAWRDLATW